VAADAAEDVTPSKHRPSVASGENRVAVIGGGYAGLAAAVELAAGRVPVTIFEAAKQLGGRARRVVHRGMALDNGCHILVGGYHETLKLLERVSPVQAGDSPSLMRLGLELYVPGKFHLRAPRLPAPLHSLAGLLGAKGLPLSEKLLAIRFMRTMKGAGFRLAADEPVASLLARHGQTGAVARFLWAPLCLATLNTPPPSASAQIFLNVLRDSLYRGRGASDLLLPRVDLSRLFPDPAAKFLAKQGAIVRLGATVDAILVDGDRLLVDSGGVPTRFSRVVCATPPNRAATLLAAMPGLETVATKLNRLQFQPIYSVYLQYPETVRLPRPMTGMTGGLGQWAFDRGALCGQPGLVGVVISGPGGHESMGRDAIAERIAGELATMLPGLPAPRWHWVIAEKRATIASTVGLERPASETAVPGLYLAGDYTDPDYPSTLEAAVRSGVKCARLILERGIGR